MYLSGLLKGYKYFWGYQIFRKKVNLSFIYKFVSFIVKIVIYLFYLFYIYLCYYYFCLFIYDFWFYSTVDYEL